jgi:hypothetical protein
MMLVKNSKAGVNKTPALLIIYFLLIALDLYTTWLASPDLRLEGNIFIRYLSLKWPHIILSAVFVGTLFSYTLFQRIIYTYT